MNSTHLLKVSRLEGLTDGIFAIAMTIMVLNLHVPLPSNHMAKLSYADVYFNLFIYVGSFIILGTNWIAMNFQWGLLERVNRIYLWTNLLYLMVICIVPFSANLFGVYPHEITSIHFYTMNLLLAYIGQFITFQSAHHFKLYKQEIYSPKIYRAVVLRMLVAPLFYVFSFITSYWNINIAFVLLILPTLIYLLPGHIDKYEGI